MAEMLLDYNWICTWLVSKGPLNAVGLNVCLCRGCKVKRTTRRWMKRDVAAAATSPPPRARKTATCVLRDVTDATCMPGSRQYEVEKTSS